MKKQGIAKFRMGIDETIRNKKVSNMITSVNKQNPKMNSTKVNNNQH
jgi:hypothetical protein